MMSNCAFWSASGELLAVHGAGPADPVASFGPWSAARRLPPGRLVPLSPGFPVLEAVVSGWQVLGPGYRPRNRKTERTTDTSAPVAVFAPALDEAAGRLLPPLFHHEKFTLKAWPTWVTTARPADGEGPEGWFAALAAGSASARYLVRLVPHRGRLPGEGWRNMLAWVLRAHGGVRLVPLNGLPSAPGLVGAPAWEYRVEAGRGAEAAAWDVQILPSRALLDEWAPGLNGPWEATALLRWVRPDAPGPAAGVPDGGWEPRWADLLARLPAADARLLVQNVLTTAPGGAAAAAVLFFDTVVLPPGPGGKTLVRHVPQDGLPLALLSTLFGRRAWHEIDRAKRFLPAEGDRRTLRSEALADLDRRLAEGRLEWSAAAQELWRVLYRLPRERAQRVELDACRTSDRWRRVLAGDPRVPEFLLRSLDVTDAALCLRDAPDARWRRFVTARREAELRAELEFCRVWEARGELTLDRQLDAWVSWDGLLATLPLTEAESGD